MGKSNINSSEEAAHLHGASDSPRMERRDAAEHRQRILSSARILFAGRGIEAVSMHQIAQAAGVGQGTLYRRYTNKGDLCLDLLQQSMSALFDEIETYLAPCASCPDPEARLDGVIVRLVTFLEDNAPLLSAVDEAFCGSRRSMQFNNPFYQRIHQTIVTLVAEITGDEDDRPDPCTFTADAVLAALNPGLYLFQRQERGFSQDQIISGMRRIYLRRMRGPRRPVQDEQTI